MVLGHSGERVALPPVRSGGREGRSDRADIAGSPLGHVGSTCPGNSARGMSNEPSEMRVQSSAHRSLVKIETWKSRHRDGPGSQADGGAARKDRASKERGQEERAELKRERRERGS